MTLTEDERRMKQTELECAPQHSTAVTAPYDDLQHSQDAGVTTTDSNSQPPSSLDTACQKSRGSLCRLFRSEVSKIIHLEVDCGLYGSDWRLVYGGSTLAGLSPCMLLFLRLAISIGHLAMLFYAKVFEEMKFVTSWTNVLALVAYLLSTVINIAAILSLNNQWLLAEATCDSDSCASAAPLRTVSSFFRRIDVGYKQLLKENRERNCHSPEPALKALQKRRCCTFRRPFDGGPRQRALETLLCMHDIAWGYALPMVIVVFLVYWLLLFPKARDVQIWITVHVHLVCPVVTWLLAVLSRFPYRLSTLPVVIMWGVWYVIVIAILQSFGHGFVYWFLNFQKRPALACGMSCCVLFVLIPVMACLSFLLMYRHTRAVIHVEQ